MPVCARCERSGRWCDRTLPLKIRHQKNVSSFGETANSAGRSIPESEDEEPRHVLRQEQAAQLFEHYLQVLASWYDLNDLDCGFARVVGREAQKTQLLLNAVLAFAAIHKCRTGQSSLKELGDMYHNRCLRLLIGLRQSDEAIANGTALAATCLLRSYEILAGKYIPVSEEPYSLIRGKRSQSSPVWSLFSAPRSHNDTTRGAPFACRAMELSSRRHHICTDKRVSPQNRHWQCTAQRIS